jgi:hypothetical protein
MNSRKINKVTMTKAVQLILTSLGNEPQTPAFVRTVSDFNNSLSSIEGLMQAQAKKVTGTTMDKDAAEDAAIDAALSIIGPIRSYAVATGNNSLNEALPYTQSGLKRTRDEMLLNTLILIRDMAQLELPNLEDYGIDAASVNALSVTIAVYSPLVAAPRAAISVKVAITEALEVAFEDLELVLMRLDGLVEAKRMTNPDFYNSYNSARVVVDAGGGYSMQDADAPPSNAQ